MSLKKILTSITLSSLFLSSCSSSLRASYDLSLDSVENNSKPSEYKKTRAITLNSKETGFLSYEDNNINIIWSPSEYNFRFNLLNKTNSTIKLLWNDSIFVYTNNQSHKIINGKSKVIDDGNAIQDMPILKGSFIEDSIYPSKWGVHEIFETYIIGNNDKIKKELFNEYNKQFIRILLPLLIDNKRVDYLFNFKIDNLSLFDN